MPPDMQVEPPISSCFSSTSALAPASAAASAADHAAAARPDDHEVDGTVSHVDVSSVMPVPRPPARRFPADADPCRGAMLAQVSVDDCYEAEVIS